MIGIVHLIVSAAHWRRRALKTGKVAEEWKNVDITQHYEPNLSQFRGRTRPQLYVLQEHRATRDDCTQVTYHKTCDQYYATTTHLKVPPFRSDRVLALRRYHHQDNASLYSRVETFCGIIWSSTTHLVYRYVYASSFPSTPIRRNVFSL